MIIYQVHKEHGKHISYTSLEAESNRKRGWRDVTEEEFYGKRPQAQSVPAVEASVVTEASPEAPKADPAPAKKRGRPPKVTPNG